MPKSGKPKLQHDNQKSKRVRVWTKIEQEQTDSECSRKIAAIERRIGEIGYDTEKHNALRTALRSSVANTLSTASFSSARCYRQRSQDLTQALQAYSWTTK